MITVAQTMRLREQLERGMVDMRLEAAGNWIELRAVPDGITWLATMKTSSGSSQGFCLSGGPLLFQQMTALVSGALVWLRVNKYGFN